MDSLKFEPFQDRLSRDIRNDLSSAMMESLKNGNTAAISEVANRYLAQSLEKPYREYIDDRLARYEKALGVIWKSDEGNDHFFQGLVLWDCGLQFELHNFV